MNSEDIVTYVKRLLSTSRLSLHDEMTLQREMTALLAPLDPANPYRLDDKNIIDFFIKGVGIEVKIKGSRQEIYRQCVRYCGFEEIQCLVLVTNRAMGFPKEINGKPTYVINLGLAWL